MSHLHADWRRRAAISVPNTAGSGTIDVDITIPPDWDAFWSRIDASGNELRVTSADGRTLVTYDVDKPGGGAFSASARTGRIRIDGATVPAVPTSTALFWLYYDPETTQGDASSAVTMSGALDGYIELGVPVDRRVSAAVQRPGLQRPQNLTAKAAGATEHHWIDLAPLLQRYATPVAERLYYEEIAGVIVTAVDENDALASTIIDNTATRFVEFAVGALRRMYARVTLTAGTSGTRYTATVTARTVTPAAPTSVHRTLSQRLGLVVRDELETPE